MAEIFIDSEFANYIRPLSDEEFEKLKESIKLEGIRDPLVVWNGFLIDGYHRYKIATELEIEFKTIEIDLPDKEAVKEWIIKNQLGRRNLTSQEASYYRGKLYESRKLNHGGDRKSSVQNAHLKKTAEIIGKEYGVNESTIRRDAEFSKAVDKVAEKVGKEAKNAILSGQINIPKKDVEKIIKIKEEAPEFIEPILKGEKTISEINRKINRTKKINEIIEKASDKKRLSDIGVYSVIYADPPWRYDYPISDSRRIENHYPTMDINEICDLEVQKICNDDAILFLWVTSPMLENGLKVLKNWGFEYRTSMVWVKPTIGMGQWVRQRHEFVLIGVKGNLPTPEGSNKPDSVIESPREEHSKKPDILYEIIEKMYPELSKVELFSRKKREGWDNWGFES